MVSSHDDLSYSYRQEAPVGFEKRTAGKVMGNGSALTFCDMKIDRLF